MYRLLVADDESLIVRGVCRTLGRLGMFEIEWALNGKDAWEILERKQTDAMLLDINMPDIDGITLLKKLSEIDADVETVIISGYEAFDYAQEALWYGALDYLLKPLTPKDVEAVGIKLYERLEARKKRKRSTGSCASSSCNSAARSSRKCFPTYCAAPSSRGRSRRCARSTASICGESASP